MLNRDSHPSGDERASNDESIELETFFARQEEPAKRTTPIPSLRLDTSNLNTPTNIDTENDPDYDSLPSAILGIAKKDNLRINNWLTSENSERLSPAPASPGIRFGSSRKSSRKSSVSSKRSPSRNSSRNQSPSRWGDLHSPEINRVASPLGELRPVNLEASPESEGPAPSKIPKITVTVERSFSNPDRASPYQLSHASDPGSAETGNVPVQEPYLTAHSLHRSSVIEPNSLGISRTLSPRDSVRNSHEATVRNRASPASKRHVTPGNVDSYNLSLSGAAFLTQHDILDSDALSKENEGSSLIEPSHDASDAATNDDAASAVSTDLDEFDSDRQVPAEPLGRSLFLFYPNNALRRLCFRIFSSEFIYWIEFLLTIVQMVVLCLEVRNTFESQDDGTPLVLNRKFLYVYSALYAIYTLFFVAKAIAFGVITNQILSRNDSRKLTAWWLRFLGHLVSFGAVKAGVNGKLSSDRRTYHNCVLRNSWGRVDFLSIVAFWIFAGLSADTTVYSLELIIAGLGQIRILRILDYIPYTKFVLHVLKQAMPLLQNVLFFIGFFLFIWGIIGVLSFNGSLRRVCITGETISKQRCGGWLDPDTLQVMPYLLLDSRHGKYQNQSRIKGYTCPVGSKCVELRAFPPYGSYAELANMSFDNIFNSIEIVFIMMSMNGFTEILYDIIDSESLVSSLYFISGVLVLGVWLMNLLVAVMLSSYGAIKEGFQSYLEPADPITRFAKKITRKLFTSKSHTGYDPEAQSQTDDKRDHGKWIAESSRWGKKYQMVAPFIAVLTLVDLIVQAAKTPPNTGLFTWEIVLAVVFALDVLVRFFIYLPYWRYFFYSFTNILDVFLAVTNCIILAFHDDTELYNWLTAFQLLRIHKMIASLKYSRIFWIQVFGNFKALISLTVFFFLTNLLCTLIASKMLRGQFPVNDEDGNLNVNSFYNLAVSYISMQQIASTENWTDILFFITENVSRPGDNVIGLACMGILICAWLLFANFLIFNLFLGIMSESLHGAITNKREEQVRQFAEEIRDKSMNPSGPKFGKLLSGLSLQEEYEYDTERPVSLKDKLLSIPLKWISQESRQNVVLRPLRAQLERKLAIEFLESHSELENFTGGKLVSGKTFLNLESDEHQDSFENWRTFPIYRMSMSLMKKVYGWVHNFPNDYRKLLTERFDDNVSENETKSKRAYVERVFDHHRHYLSALNDYCASHPNFDKSLMIFDITNPIRQFCQKLFGSSSGPRRSKIYPNRWVGFYVRVFFLSATVAIVVETCVKTPLKMFEDENSTKVSYNRLIDIIFGGIFSLEFLMKIIADGVHYTPNAYTRSWWNCLDFVVLVSIWMTFINDLYSGPLTRYLRALLALRALRLVSISQRSELLLQSIFKYGFRNLTGAFLIALSIVIPYSVWGKNIFHGRLDSCNDGSISYLSDCTGEYIATAFDDYELLAPRSIDGQYFSYDNFWESLMIQFGVLSLEGWIDVLQAVSSISGPNLQSETYVSKGNAAFPIFYNYIGAVLIMSMLIAVIIRNYALTIGTAFLTEEQLSWIDVKRTLKMVTPTPKAPSYPRDSLRARLLSMIPTWITSIEVWILLIVTADMSAYFYPLRASVEDIYYLILLACSTLLLSLSVLKLIVLKPHLFFHNLWNPFGLVVCLAVVVTTILNLLLPDSHNTGALGTSRAAIICLLLLWIPRIKRLYQFYSIGTAAISEIGMLLFAWLILYITYAIALNQSFGLAKLGAESTWSRNFRTIPNSLISLFTMSCGEGWNEYLIDFTMSSPYCRESSTVSECGIPGFAYFLFITWNILSMYIFANVFISVVCEACWYVYRSGPVNIRESDILNLLDSWQKFDPKGTGFIRINDIYKFLRSSQGYFSLSIFSDDPRYSVPAILQSVGSNVRAVADPYYVDMDAINAYLADMPVQKYRDKRALFELFIAHAQSQADRVPGGDGINFSKLVLLFPLYRDMNPETVLSLKEFLALKVQLHEARITMAANFIARTWRSKRRKFGSAMAETPGMGYNQNIHDPAYSDSVYWVS